MLHQEKVLQELHAVADTLFKEVKEDVDDLYQQWCAIQNDVLLLAKVQAASTLGLATWMYNFSTTVLVSAYEHPYHCLGIDGSQIYPDKHTGTSCFLINIGTVWIAYNNERSQCRLDSIPFVYPEQEMDNEIGRAIDIVNGKREELEFKVGLEQSISVIAENPSLPYLFLFDGSLIFWHLQGKEPAIKAYFMQRYAYYLQSFYKHSILIAGYISLTKGKDVIHIVQASYNNFSSIVSEKTERFAHLSDAVLVQRYVQPGYRTTVFKSNLTISHELPEAVQPYFFYYNTGHEIVRIEVPAYIALDEKKVETVASLIKNQVEKGHGYPIILAEAHEQAVVRAAERELFYKLVSHLGIDQKKVVIPSQKSVKKRKMHV